MHDRRMVQNFIRVFAKLVLDDFHWGWLLRLSWLLEPLLRILTLRWLTLLLIKSRAREVCLALPFDFRCVIHGEEFFVEPLE